MNNWQFISDFKNARHMNVKKPGFLIINPVNEDAANLEDVYRPYFALI